MPAPSRRRFLALASLATTAAAAAPQEPTFSSSVTLIRVDAEVLQDDRMIEGLTAQDFEVLDNGQPQPVRNLSRDLEPLDIVLLFDISGSMEWVAKKVATAAERALAALQPGDRAAVMTFHTWQDLVEPLTGEMPHIVEAVRLKVLRSRFGGGTHLTAAAGEAVKILAAAEGGRRRAVIALTDNRGTASRREDRVLNEFWEADALLCGIITVQDPRQFAEWKSRQIGPQLAVPEQGLGNLILQTGGAAITTDEPGHALEDMLRRLRSRYTLYYSMPASAQPGKARKTQVRLRGAAAQRHPNAQIRARGGYLAPRSVE
jgi:VWFA-related protein